MERNRKGQHERNRYGMHQGFWTARMWSEHQVNGFAQAELMKILTDHLSARR